MSSSLYSFDSIRGFLPPSAIPGESITGNGSTEEALSYASDTQDGTRNSALKSHESSASFSYTPVLERQAGPPFLLTPAKVRAGTDALFGKAELSSSSGSRGSSCRPQRLSEGLRESVDGLKPYNYNELFTPPTIATSDRQRSSDLYGLGGMLCPTLPQSDDGDCSDGNRLPFLFIASAKEEGASRGSAPSSNRMGGDVHTTAASLRNSYGGFADVLGTTVMKSSIDSAGVLLRSSVQLASLPPSSAAKVVGVDTENEQTPLYGELRPLLFSAHSTRTSAATTTDLNGRGSARHNEHRRVAPGNASATLAALDDPLDDGNDVALGQTYPRSDVGGSSSNTQRSSSATSFRSPSPLRTISVRGRRLSDGDLRRRSRSRSSEYSSPGGPLAISLDRSGHRAPRLSPARDDEVTYFTLGSTESPITQLGSTSTTRNPTRTAGVVETHTSATDVFKSCREAQPQPSQRQNAMSKTAASSSASGDARAALGASREAQRFYDFSFVKGFAAGDDDGEGGESDVLLDYSALEKSAPNLQRDVNPWHGTDDDVFIDADYGNLMNLASASLDSKKRQQNSPHAPPNASPAWSSTTMNDIPDQAPLPANREPAARLNSLRPLPVTPLDTSALGATHSNAPSQPEQKHPMFTTIRMAMPAMDGSGRRFTFDGPQTTKDHDHQHHKPSRSTSLPNEKYRSPHSVVTSGSSMEMHTLPSLAIGAGQTSEKTPPTAKGPKTSGGASATTATKSPSDARVSSGDLFSLPSIAGATRQPHEPSPSVGRSNAPQSNKPSAALSSPAQSSGTSAADGDPAAKLAMTDASLSPITSEKDSVETTDQSTILHAALRQVQSSVRIRTEVCEADLLPLKNVPWPLPPAAQGIMIHARVFDPHNLRPRGQRIRTLPNGKRRANWMPPETHYTTTLADLAASDDEEDLEAGEQEVAKFLAMQELDDGIWDGEGMDENRSFSGDQSSPTCGSAVKNGSPPLPAWAPLRVATVPSTPTAVPTAPRPLSPDKAYSANSKGMRAAHLSSSPASTNLTVLATADSTVPRTDVPLLVADDLLQNAAYTSKRYGGIVVDEVEKVRRMREDSLMTSLTDELDAVTTLRMSLSDIEVAGSPHHSAGSSQRASSLSLARLASPRRVSRGADERPISPYMTEVPGNKGATSGKQRTPSGSIRESSHFEHGDSLALDASGVPVIPQSPSMPTFARIIAKSSGGGVGASSSHSHNDSSGTVLHSGSRADLGSANDTTTDRLKSPSDRQSMVTFAGEELASRSPRQR
ncbi:hypothetical protein ABL78_3412 [Leptomonas seymouri]|uniref:Uncharacterized protein n=1 Tax=Leptomonas seymouri TaxID=5684 RepID=A0A0N1I7T8_LEPSE|nr:hypothetical protein ABL78_3412 [Leptomonas seymouri]|eukprot:KPI87501.1 hypothetical protein ABL78_3412 [Leptomonas seymouri]